MSRRASQAEGARDRARDRGRKVERGRESEGGGGWGAGGNIREGKRIRNRRPSSDHAQRQYTSILGNVKTSTLGASTKYPIRTHLFLARSFSLSLSLSLALSLTLSLALSLCCSLLLSRTYAPRSLSRAPSCFHPHCSFTYAAVHRMKMAKKHSQTRTYATRMPSRSVHIRVCAIHNCFTNRHTYTTHMHTYNVCGVCVCLMCVCVTRARNTKLSH